MRKRKTCNHSCGACRNCTHTCLQKSVLVQRLHKCKAFHRNLRIASAYLLMGWGRGYLGLRLSCMLPCGSPRLSVLSVSYKSVPFAHVLANSIMTSSLYHQVLSASYKAKMDSMPVSDKQEAARSESVSRERGNIHASIGLL